MTLALVKNNNISYLDSDLLTLQGNFAEKFIQSHKSEQTKRAYKHDILEFFATTHTNQITLDMVKNISATQALLYVKHISAKNSKATVNRKLCAIRSLIDYVNFIGEKHGIKICNVFENKYLKRNINNQTSKVNKTVDTFKPHEIEKLLAICKSTAKIPQHYVILKLLFNTMARRDEIVNIYPEDIFQITNKNNEIEYGLKLHGKGRKERSIYISEELKDLLLSVSFGKNCPIFHYTGDNILKILKNYCRKAGIFKDKISPHIARHSCATIAYDNDVPIEYIQQTLGHEHKKTTEGYISSSKTIERSATRCLSF